MLKFIADQVWAFDLEWVPDPPTGRRVYNLPELNDDDIVQKMWDEGGATPENPQPYLKTTLCRIVSVAAIIRKRAADGSVILRLTSQPKVAEGPIPEKTLLKRFLGAFAEASPQLVGFNLANSDIPILIQRGVAHGMRAVDFCRRPEKPWEGRDYFVKYSDWCIDLKNTLAGWGNASASLHELATSSGIPGKMGVDGSNVFQLWKAGSVDEIVQYNQFDALTTYLLWLRTAHFSGLLDTTSYETESRQLEVLLEAQGASGESHLLRYLERWRQLRQ